MFQRRVVGLVLASFAAGLMAFSLLSHRWWAMKEDDDTVSFGLRSVELCDEDYDDGRTREDCRTMSLGKMFRGEDEDDDRAYEDERYHDDEDEEDFKEPTSFILLGNLTFFGGIAAGVLLVICGGAVLMNQHTRASKGLGTATAVASAVYGGAALLFVLMAPNQLDEIPFGMSLPLALIAASCGLAAGLVLGNYDPGVEPRIIPAAHMLTGLAPSKAPSLVLAAAGIVLVSGAIFTNTWWGRSEDEFSVSVGVREAESCSKPYDSGGDYGYDDYDRSSRGRERCMTQTMRVRESHSDYDDDEDQDSGKTFIRAGHATYLVGITLCVVTLLAGALMLTGQRLPGQLTPANIAVGLAGVFLLASLVYLASKPSMMKELHASFGPVLALAGGGCLIGAGIAMGRYAPPGSTAQWAGGPIGPLGPSGPMAPMPMGVPLAPLGAPYSGPQTPPHTPTAIPQMPMGDVRSGQVTPACPQCAAPMVFAPQHGRWFCGSCRIYA